MDTPIGMHAPCKIHCDGLGVEHHVRRNRYFQHAQGFLRQSIHFFSRFASFLLVHLVRTNEQPSPLIPTLTPLRIDICPGFLPHGLVLCNCIKSPFEAFDTCHWMRGRVVCALQSMLPRWSQVNDVPVCPCMLVGMSIVSG